MIPVNTCLLKILIFICLSASLHGQNESQILLKDGTKISGEIIDQTSDKLIVKFKGKEVSINKSDIVKVSLSTIKRDHSSESNVSVKHKLYRQFEATKSIQKLYNYVCLAGTLVGIIILSSEDSLED